MKSKQKPRERVTKVADIHKVYTALRAHFGKVHCPLTYAAPHELCIAVILSAQCTDARVNTVTPALFSRFKTPADFACAEIGEIEKLIHSTGFYHNKARSIQGFCRQLVTQHDGFVPNNIPDLIAMPGIGRKTANVVMQELYGIADGIVVDTHVARLSNLLGLTKHSDAVKIERNLIEKVPRSYWMDWSLYMIFLGRSSCTARKRNCGECVLRNLCPSSTAKALV
ncbi:MAG: endonuclease III [Leptospirales bacterium]|nr:endonuclease III [Leptospirales bacterium]